MRILVIDKFMQPRDPAQTYHLQAEYVQLTSKIIGGYFKYEDYVSGRGNPELLKKVFMDWYKSVED